MRDRFPSRPACFRPRLALLCLGLAILAVGTGCVRRELAPRIQSGALHIVSLTAEPDTIFLYDESRITSVIDNPAGGAVSYSWTAYRGSVVSDGPSARYFGSYCCAGTDWVVLQVRNDRDEQDTKLIVLTVYQTER